MQSFTSLFFPVNAMSNAFTTPLSSQFQNGKMKGVSMRTHKEEADV